jgi:hypothetical protein
LIVPAGEKSASVNTRAGWTGGAVTAPPELDPQAARLRAAASAATAATSCRPNREVLT